MTVETSAGQGPIAIDAMGADLGPAEVVEAISLVLGAGNTVGDLILVGDKGRLETLLAKKGLTDHPQLRLHHASQVIGMGEKPITSIKQKKDSSMVRAVELVKNGEAAAVISCGNTGSLMSAGTLLLRRMTGIERPALGTIIPSRDKPFLLIDSGANPDPTPKRLAHNAVLGAQYMQSVLGVKQPRVGLLTIGTEEGKGTEIVKQTHALLHDACDIVNYIGPIEGFQIFENHVDVAVVDGFTGNILLKGLESVFKMLSGYLKEELKANPLRMAGAMLSRGAFQEMKNTLSPDRYGGAPLLGVRGVVIKGHGSSDRHFIESAIRIGREAVAHDLTENIQNDIRRINECLKGNFASDQPASTSSGS